jgi:hypothetical protein
MSSMGSYLPRASDNISRPETPTRPFRHSDIEITSPSHRGSAMSMQSKRRDGSNSLQSVGGYSRGSMRRANPTPKETATMVPLLKLPNN